MSTSDENPAELKIVISEDSAHAAAKDRIATAASMVVGVGALAVLTLLAAAAGVLSWKALLWAVAL